MKTAILDFLRIECGLNKYQWFRRWYGGRWERHFIDVCMTFIWLPMDQKRKWPAYRQPCSIGTPIIEDYPVKELP